MDNEMVAKEMMKEFIIKFRPFKRTGHCPFYNHDTRKQMHELCAEVFPGWGKKHLEKWRIASKKRESAYVHCPCAIMSRVYVRRKARAFVAKK